MNFAIEWDLGNYSDGEVTTIKKQCTYKNKQVRTIKLII